MRNNLTIGEVAQRVGLPSKTIRFYESQGVIAAPQRTEAGYRLYSASDIRRLRLAKRARLLGLSLPEVKSLVDQAFTSECSEFGAALLERVASQRAEVQRRIAELEALDSELQELEHHVQRCDCEAEPGQLVANCSFCSLIDEEGGESG
jgi:MerR family copper efflux transcriptional regulator